VKLKRAKAKTRAWWIRFAHRAFCSLCSV